MNTLPLVSIVIPTHNREKQLLRLTKSIESSSYPRNRLEIIVVNNGTSDISLSLNGKIINNGKNLGLAKARNQGAKAAKGKYILFIDDDNVVDSQMIERLTAAMEESPNLLLAGPVTYYLGDKKKIWFLGSKLNMWTTIPTFYKNISEERVIHHNQFVVENLHNCFFVASKKGQEVGWFDEKVFMNGTEFDLIQRMKLKHGDGYCATITDAYCYHDVPTYSENILRSMGFATEKRVYYFQRNRGLHVSRYGKWYQKVTLFFLFYPLFLLGYGMLFLFFGKLDYLKQHIRGTVAGYAFLMRK